MTPPSIERHLGEGEQLFFLHIPKTAGISFNTPISDKFDIDAICPRYFEEQLEGDPRTILDPYNYIRGHFSYSLIQQLANKPPLTITMLRNPAARFISHFNHWRQGGHYGLFASQKLPPPTANMTLAEFVQHPLGEQIQNLQTSMLAADIKLASDPSRIHVESRTPLTGAAHVEKAIKLLDDCAFFGFTERFEESLHLLSYVFGWRHLHQPPHFNKSSMRSAGQAAVPPEVMDKVNALNTLDADLYERAKPVFEQRLRQMTDELLEQYGSKAHASLGFPLPSDVMHDLLEVHYERRFMAAHIPQAQWKVTFDKGISGEGWHPPDTRPPYGWVRWTGPTTEATLDLPLTTTEAKAISFCVIEAIAPDVLASLKLYVNGVAISLMVSRNADKAYVFEGYVSQAILTQGKGLSTLKFETNRTAALSELKPGHSETRPFGVQIAWIEVTPAIDGDAAMGQLLNRQSEVMRETLNQLAATEAELHDLTHSRLMRWAIQLRALIQKLRGKRTS
jgi:hypothetical protein